jgi:tetratricopeptide (TPR) repeat protein
MAGHPKDNPYFREYERLVYRLHRLIAAGKGDADEAEAARDEMEEAWRHLSAEELGRLDGLLGDLYMLQNDEVFQPIDADESAHEALDAELQAAWRQERWEDVLRLLRKGPPSMPMDEVAYLRARAYDQLGHVDAALLFMQYAAKLKPDDATYQFSLMEMLRTARRLDEAVALAESWIDRRDLPPALVVQAASVLLPAAKERSLEGGKATYQRIIEGLQTALQDSSERWQEETMLGYLKEVMVLGNLILGSCYQALEEWAHARDAYEKAFEVAPDDPRIFTARGILRMKTDPPAATADFEAAVARGVPIAAPYLFLAHNALLRHDYRRCLDLCNSILSRPQRPRTAAAALQWAAIAQYELHFPPEVVRHNFLTALRLDPLNDQIRSSSEQFENSVRSGPATHDQETLWPAVQNLDPSLMSPHQNLDASLMSPHELTEGRVPLAA